MNAATMPEGDGQDFEGRVIQMRPGDVMTLPAGFTMKQMEPLTPDKISPEDFATLCRIVGTDDPGPNVCRMEVLIDWQNQRVETRFTFPAFRKGER
jgi:hypothetical protein